MGWSCGATRGRTSPPDRVRTITLPILYDHYSTLTGSLLWVLAGNPGEVTRPELVKYLHEQWTPLVKEFCDEPGPDGDDEAL